MNILLIGMGFYQYEEEIKKTLEGMGHDVTVIFDAPKEAVAHRNFVRKDVSEAIIKKHQEKTAKELSKSSLDCVITIVGRHLTPSFLKKIRHDHSGAEFVLYLWDDVGRVENFREVSGFYDRILSFDPEDCREYGFTFLPLFYIDRYRTGGQERRKEALFSAFFLHSDRLELTRSLLDSKKIPAEIVIVAGFRRWLIWNLRRAQKKKDIEMGIRILAKSQSMEETAREMSGHTAVLDIQHPTQRGLTMRTFEAMAAGTKLVTTNKSVQFYDFYDPGNIAVIDCDKPVIPAGFIETPFHHVPEDIISAYSLESWVLSVLGMKAQSYLAKTNPYGI